MKKPLFISSFFWLHVSVRGYGFSEDNYNYISYEEKIKVLLPEDGPDKFPEEKLNSLYEKDSSPVDSLCSPTSQVEISLEKYSNTWKLQSLDVNGAKKTVGGDEFYVTYSDDSYASLPHPTAVAYVTDMKDGSYDLYFVGTRMEMPDDDLVGAGNLTVWLEYTCNVGKIWPPGKQKWGSNGSLNRKYETHISSSPMYHIPSPIVSDVYLGGYDVVLAMGDSVMSQFLCVRLKMRRNNLFMEQNTGELMKSETLSYFTNYVDSLKALEIKGRKVAILMNYGSWDLAKSNEGQESFQDHLITLRKLVNYIKTRLPNVDLIWRSTTAQHVHRAPDIERVMYVSASRTKALHDAQMDLMRELDIPVIDIYNFTFENGRYTKVNDAIHYMDFIFHEILQQIYPSWSRTTSKYCKLDGERLLNRQAII